MTARAPLGPVPSWDRAWPGRYVAELDALVGAGTGFSIDEDRLAAGTLDMVVEWRHRGRSLRLRAIYPESFPWTRPMVFLEAAADELPPRHCSPTDGQLCLLGRDTRQWRWGWTLQHLLDSQLASAMDGEGEQDPQAEPMEVWWNSLATAGAGYCLVDSGWDPGGSGRGEITVAFDPGIGADPQLRVCAIAAAKPGYTASFDPQIRGLCKKAEIPWVHLAQAPVPTRSGSDLEDLVRIHFPSPPRRRIVFDVARQGTIYAFSYPMEVSHGVAGTGWLFVVASVARLASSKRGQRDGPARLIILQVLRAGAEDMLARDPTAAKLAGKRIVVFGVGAIGAPIALGLARSGARDLHLVDHDVVEPGNAVRWVAGASAWGRGKAEVLAASIDAEQPSCEVTAHRLMVGGTDVDFGPVLAGADLVVDATTAYGPGMWLGAECKARNIPLLMAMAWAGDAVAGGLVALHAPGGGCPHCLEFAQHRGEVPPLGDGAEEPALQPPGCGERTFRGAACDLQEISLQALRMAPAALAAPSFSVVATMSFEAGPLGMRTPRWDMREFRTFRECGCAAPSA